MCDLTAEQLRAELAEADQLAVLRTRLALEEFENAFREFRRERRGVVSHAVLDERRRLAPLPPDHPLAQRTAWTAADLDKSAWRVTGYNQRAVPVGKRFPEVGL